MRRRKGAQSIAFTSTKTPRQSYVRPHQNARSRRAIASPDLPPGLVGNPSSASTERLSTSAPGHSRHLLISLRYTFGSWSLVCPSRPAASTWLNSFRTPSQGSSTAAKDVSPGTTSGSSNWPHFGPRWTSHLEGVQGQEDAGRQALVLLDGLDAGHKASFTRSVLLATACLKMFLLGCCSLALRFTTSSRPKLTSSHLAHKKDLATFASTWPPDGSCALSGFPGEQKLFSQNDVNKMMVSGKRPGQVSCQRESSKGFKRPRPSCAKTERSAHETARASRRPSLACMAWSQVGLARGLPQRGAIVGSFRVNFQH